MRPEVGSQRLLGITRSKAKMFEYGVPSAYHIEIPLDPAKLFTLATGLLGDLAARSNSEVRDEDLKDLSDNLQFSARFFDSYLLSQFNAEMHPYLQLLGAASYYLCDLPGSALVLAKSFANGCPDLGCLGLEDLILWLLKDDMSTYYDKPEGPYGDYIDGISKGMIHYYENGNGMENLFKLTSRFRKTAYTIATPRQLLFTDIICAIVKRRIYNSSWYSLPLYSGLAAARWQLTLRKESFVRELWPAQHLLGEQGIFRGTSAVVQMPTSAGKTKAIEIIIRSSFFSDRTSLAVIVAPFRALSHEISNSLIGAFLNESVYIDELSDVLQADFEIRELLGRKQVLVVTPEKLIFMLRHAPEIAENIGLLIYDEGHQFDSGTRGITYELLLTSLKTMVPKAAQTILFSAVMSNAEAVNDWLNGEQSAVVYGTNLIPTYRTIAFASWVDLLGRLEFVASDNPDEGEFFVPRIIEQQKLQLKRKERKPRLFPEKNDGQDIALFLGLRLVNNGGVAIFCGRKDTASNLCDKVVGAYNRGLTIPKPVDYSDHDEMKRLHLLYESNLGIDAVATQSAGYGIYTHHGNTPHGIRLAVEHAMKEGLAKFVICTSTLAQGVNMPIRYLIVTSVYQGQERIKVRDFHNLIGRAGRSGMHTEGSILFADPEVYDKRRSQYDGWRWAQVKELLDPKKSEPCASSLLSIFEPLRSDDRKYFIRMEPLEIAKAYVHDLDKLNKIPEDLAKSQILKGKYSVNEIDRQIHQKIEIISAIESYLMVHWDDSESGLKENVAVELAQRTLAYFLADEGQKLQIIELFKLLAQNIEQNVPEEQKRKVFGKTLYGVRSAIAIEDWLNSHIDELVSCGDDHFSLLMAVWPILADNIQNNTFRKCKPAEALQSLAVSWIIGQPFYEILEILEAMDARLVSKTQRRHLTLEYVVDICENALSYEGMLALGAVAKLVEYKHSENNADLIRNLHVLQKRIKYGLPSSLAIILYESGFADRVVTMDLCTIINPSRENKKAVIREVRKKARIVRELLSKYPSYFTLVLDNLIA